jgi:rhamnose utilization protein RhaD (predicted bifunctional aldolase and dehydrogenase)/NAD(P)-dependent dehydrogenase (short-subunit alcohol dehydrogenase family)
MVENRWRDADAAAFLAKAGEDPADQAVALRVYTSRLIGSDPDLVMHGGGNTSVKVRRRDLFGREIDVLHVKGSGWDLDTLEAPGLPGVRLDGLRELRKLDHLSDEDMVNVQRCNLLDSTSPNPSVETLLHAFLPHIHIDHSHATAMLALANQPEAARFVREIYGERIALVPYVMPGFDLAKLAATVYEDNPQVEGLLLVNHGHFTFGESARQSYDRMIQHVAEAEAYFIGKGRPAPTFSAAKPIAATDILPTLRGNLSVGTDENTALPVFELRRGPAIDAFFARPDMAALGRRGVVTPDHVIRTKCPPLILTPDIIANGRIAEAVEAWRADYRAYFDRHAPQAKEKKTMLAPMPSLAWIPGLGLIGIGATASAARIAADLGEQTLRVITLAESIGTYKPIAEADLFEMEYWSLEQAKLGKGAPPPFAGRIVLVTGGAGAIGLATAQAFKAKGANVFIVDRDAAALATALKGLGRDAGGRALDLCAEGAAQQAIAACVERFGGIDILVSNAGAAMTGEIATLPEQTLRQSFELNFFAHQAITQVAVAVLREQGRGGNLLFNVSKQAVNPGKGFGAYGLPKAATFFLVKQYALEHGADGIRVNGINADRIRSGLLTEDFIASRAKARGIDTKTYMTGNLLQREVEAKHVAEAFVMLAGSVRTTGHVMTVDGGNIEASLR